MTQGHTFKQALRKKPVTWDDLFALLDGLTEEGRLKTAIATDPDIDIGDVHMLDIANAKINPATKESVDAIAAEVASMHHLIRGKITLASGVTLTCTANATNYTQDVVAGSTYRITAGSGRILLGEADTTSAANVLMVVFPGQTVAYQAQSEALHYSTVDGAGITARLSRVDMG